MCRPLHPGELKIITLKHWNVLSTAPTHHTADTQQLPHITHYTVLQMLSSYKCESIIQFDLLCHILSPLLSRAPDGLLPSPVSPLRATLRVMSWPAETANIKLPRTNHSTAQLHCSLPVFVPTPWWPNLSEISKTFDWIPSCPLFRYRYFISLKKVDFIKKSNSILDKRCAALPHFVFVIFCNDLFNSMKVCPP